MDKDDIKLLTEIEQRSKSNAHRLDEHDKKIEDLEKTYSIMQKMDLRVSNIEGSVKSINTKLDAQSEKKGMKWDKLIDYIFYAILAYCLYKLGLKP